MTANAVSCACALLFAAVLAQAQEAKPPAAPLPIPEKFVNSVEFAERRGRELFEHDQAAGHATDTVRPTSRRWQKKLAGWITVPQPESPRPLVRFLVESAPGVFASRVDVAAGAKPAEHDPPIALPEGEQQLAQARALAIRERKRQCTDDLNSVVLRDASGEIHVYLLAASKRGEVVLAGHDLARVRADGREILAWRPFSKSCLISKRKLRAVALVVTHILDPTPVETHVFTSLRDRIAVYVGTEPGNWVVEGGQVRLVEEREESE